MHLMYIVKMFEPVHCTKLMGKASSRSNTLHYEENKRIKEKQNKEFEKHIFRTSGMFF